jgi:hypothetical protein
LEALRELTSSHNTGSAPDNFDTPYKSMYAIADEKTVAEYGALMSTRGLERIHTWQENRALSSYQTPEHGSVADIKSASGSDKVSLAEGWLRQKIDDYERYVGRV